MSTRKPLPVLFRDITGWPMTRERLAAFVAGAQAALLCAAMPSYADEVLHECCRAGVECQQEGTAGPFVLA